MNIKKTLCTIILMQLLSLHGQTNIQNTLLWGNLHEAIELFRKHPTHRPAIKKAIIEKVDNFGQNLPYFIAQQKIDDALLLTSIIGPQKYTEKADLFKQGIGWLYAKN